MRKIIGFRLVLRPHEIKRRAKKSGVDLQAAGLDDSGLQALIGDLSSLSPRVLFGTFKRPNGDQPPLTPMPGLAYSLVLASLGDAPWPASMPEEVRRLVQEIALDEAVHFATALLEDEAAKDSCQLSPLIPLSGPALASVLARLDGSKIGVSLGDSGLLPAASTAVSVSWLSKSKARGKTK